MKLNFLDPHKASADLVLFGLVWVVITYKKGPNSQNALGLKLFRSKFQLNIINMVWFGMVWFCLVEIYF